MALTQCQTTNLFQYNSQRQASPPDSKPLKTVSAFVVSLLNFHVEDDIHHIVHLESTRDWSGEHTSFLVDQKLDGSGASVDSIGHWQGEPQFTLYHAPKQFAFMQGATGMSKQHAF